MKKLWKKRLFPHPAVLMLLAAASAALLTYCLIKLDEAHPVSIAAYTLAFCTLVLICLRIPSMVQWVQRFRRQNRWYLRYREDVQLRMAISLYSTFAFNAAYALFQLCLGVKHHSAWFYSMAVYYLLLAVMRFTLVRHTTHHLPGEDAVLEWRKYRLCGVCLLVMNLTLMVFTLYFVFRIRVFPHHEITVIAMAVSTFAALTMAIINLIRCRKYQSPAYSAARDVSLASATVSVLTLENAMLTAFGQDSSEMFRQLMLGLTGAAVICTVQAIALFMITNAGRKLKTISKTDK